MTPRYGIDTSILVRLVTGDPEAEFRHCVGRLTALVESEGAEILASGQVIGEAYVALQHHYGVTKAEARAGLHAVLTSGLVAPLRERAVLEALAARTGSGLLDRLIAADYAHEGLVTLTVDRRMAKLDRVERL